MSRRTAKAEPVKAHVIAMRDQLINVAVCAGQDERRGGKSLAAREVCVAFDVLQQMSLELLETNLEDLDGGKRRG